VTISHNSMVNLSAVSKLLLDMRFLELKREHEHLKRPLRVQRRWPIKRDHLTKGERHVYFDEWKGVDLLALVSTAFMDIHFLELKNENERLKLERFWQSYGPDKFSKQLSSFHWRMSLFRCGCVSCVKNNRFEPMAPYPPDEDEDEWFAIEYANKRWEHCEYLPWFLEFLDDMERDVGEINFEHIFIEGDSLEWSWGYGPKFLNARSVADPELRKLENIFDELYYISKLK